MKWLDNKTDHVWHVWINQEADRERNATEPKAKDIINPHEDGLYQFKSAVGSIEGIASQFTKERTKTLPMVHQQCSHSQPEQLVENHLVCGFGEKVAECPILKRLRETFTEERKRTYYSDITDEQVDHIAAATCVWHMLMGNGVSYIDWNEGAIQDTSDRMFWNRVYENLMPSKE